MWGGDYQYVIGRLEGGVVHLESWAACCTTAGVCRVVEYVTSKLVCAGYYFSLPLVDVVSPPIRTLAWNQNRIHY